VEFGLVAGIQEIVVSALALIGARQGDVSAAEIAELFCVSERQARFHLAKMTGKNLRTLCLEARLAPARPLVRDTNQAIDALATAFGYAAREKFDASYDQVYGATPAADRARARRRTVTKASRPSPVKPPLNQFQEPPLRE
jgi:transcriptional regulator GlxA family with amidase domain